MLPARLRRVPLAPLALLALGLLAAFPGRAAETYLLPATADATLYRENPDQNHGGDKTLGAEAKQRTLVRFDPATLAARLATGRLRSARLELFVKSVSGSTEPAGQVVAVHRLTADWTEPAATWNCAVDADPGNDRPDCAAPWNGGSFAPLATSVLAHPAKATGTWVSFDVTGDVKDLLAGAPGYGWLLKKADETQKGRVEYAAREGGPGEAARLRVVIDGVPDATPPALAITAPEGDLLFTAPAPPVTVRLAYSDLASGVDPATLAVAIDGVPLKGCSKDSANAECTVKNLAPGFRTITAEVTDRAGNRATALASFLLGVDLTPPTVTFVAPADGAFLSPAVMHGIDPEMPLIVASLADVETRVDPASVRFTLDGADRTAEAEISSEGLSFLPETDPAEGPHSAAVVARDLAGRETRAEVGFVVDGTPPLLAIVRPAPGAVLGETAPQEVEVSFSDPISGLDPASLRILLDGTDLTPGCQVAAGSALCTTGTLAEGAHGIQAYVRDRAGNAANALAEITVALDREPPRLAIVEPAPLVVNEQRPRIRLTASDAGSGVDPATLRVTVDGLDVTPACAFAGAEVICTPPALSRGSRAVRAEVRDRSGNATVAESGFVLDFRVAVAFTAPEPDVLAPASVVRIEGTVAAGAVAVDVNGIPAEVAGGRFRIDSFGLHDGVNELVATARDAAGNLGTAALRVLADTVPPRLSIGYPADGARLDAAEVAVTGRVSDLAIGTINATEVAVTVNGVPATIANRSFAAHLTLAPGENAITAEAVDRAGQRATASVRVRYEPPAGRPTVAVLSGDGQAAPVSSPLPAPLAVAVRDAAGQPLAGTQVIFRVVAGDGLLGDGRRAAVVATDASGEARASWTIGRRAGAGVNRVRATALGVPGEAQFCASATAGAPAAIHVASGDRQRGAIGAELPLPLFAVVYDAQGNPIEGVAVTFRVTSGGGLLAGGAPEGLATATTDGSGLAHLRFTLGPEPGLDDQIVEATAAGLDGRSALFTASAFAAGDPAATALAGVVLDNQGAPVPGVTLRIRDTTLSTRADGEGQFRLTGVPVGRAFLLVDASTASRPGTWASLEFEIFPVAGIENVLERPIHILPLDLAGGAFVDETHGGTVTLPDVPGFALEVAPGSVTFPGGGRGGVISVTAVHADSIPMAPGAGMQPRLIVTIQPAGALFDPPARMRLPNVDGLPAGAVTELFSFDHDIGAFVAIGTGTVAEDGLTIQSDPGFGVLKAGWHCGTPPSTGGACSTLDVDITNDEPILVPLPDDPQAPASGSGITAAAGAPPDVEVEATGAPSPDADYGWESGDPALLDMDPIGNGYCVNMARCASKLKAKLTGRTRVKVRHRSRTTNKVVEESKDVMVVKATITDVYSEQQPGRECNKLPVRPDLLMPGANQPMIVAAVSGYDVEISIKTKIDPPAAEPYVRVGVRKVDPFHDDVLADAPAVHDGKAKVRFIGISPEDGPHATRFEPVVGIDMNRNGKLDPDEVTGTFGNDDAHRIRVVSAGSYTVNLSEVHGREFLFNGFVLQPIGREVLQTFLGERQAPAEAQAGSVDITPGFAGLTHPFGMTWDAQCHATIADFSYGTNTGVAQEVAEAGPVVAAVQRELDRHKADVQAFFARPGSPNVAFLPADLGQPAAWTWQGDVGFRAWLTSLHPSLAVAFGSVTIRGTIPIVEVEKSGLKVRRIAYNGGFQDLYDFNYDMDICRPQAILQAGFGSLGQAGRIFNNRLQFSTQATPAYVIGGFNYSFK